MNKRGFSLIELMGIIILLSIISVLVIPSIDRAMRDFKNKSYNSQLQTIRLAANDWSTDNLGKYAMDNGQMITIALGQLKSGGYLQDDLINTKTNEPFPDDMQINIVRIEDTLKYYVLDTTGSATGNYEGAPNIGLNGNYLQRIPIGGVYTELGAYATDYQGNAITGITTTIKNSSDLTVTSVNASAAGEYKIFYSVTNNGLTRMICRTVVVYDFQEFTLLLNGPSTVAQTIGFPYVDAGAIAYDPTDGIISGNIVIQSDVDTSKVGVYYVNYSIINSALKTISIKRRVIVSDNMPPTITIIGSNPFNMQAGTYTDLGANAVDNIDGNVSHLITTNSNVTPTVLGTYSVVYTVVDSGGNTATATRTVVVSDSTFPTIAFGTNGNATWGTSRSTTVTASDTGTGVNPATLNYQWTTSTTTPTEASFTPAAVPVRGTFTNGATINSPAGVSGTYYLWILAKDFAGNTTISRTNVFNLDNGAPTITANNASSSWFASRTTTVTGTDNLAIAEIRYQWNTNGMNALCTTGGTVTTTGNVLTVPEGSNQLFLCIRDTAGNTATYASGLNTFRVDTTAPTVAFGTNGHATYAKTRSTTVTVSDVSSGVNTTTLEYQWTTSTTAPTEASFTTTFTNGATITTPAGLNGTYYLWILAKDNMPLTTITRSNAFYLDNTNPTITLLGANPFDMYTGTFSDPGATATDNIDGNISHLVIVGGNLTPTISGTYTVTYTITDTALNSATVSRTVNVIDNYPPMCDFNPSGTVSYVRSSSTVISCFDESGINDSSLKYFWNTSAGPFIEADFASATTFINNGTVNTPASTTGLYYLWIIAKDNSGLALITKSTLFRLDNTIPTVAFGMNGNATYASSRSTTVTVSDSHSGVNTSTLKYQWTKSTTAPTEASFVTSFTNGATLTTPAGGFGSNYLWILAKDNAGNTMISRSNAFMLEVVTVYYTNGTYNISLGTPTRHGESGSYLTIASTYVRQYNNNDLYVFGGWYWPTRIDLTDVAILRFTAYSTTTAQDFSGQVRSTIGGSAAASIPIAYHSAATNYDLNVSALSGLYYIYTDGYPRTQGRQVSGITTIKR